jgi:hypothetical protein
MTHFFQQRQGRVDHAGAGAVAAADELLDGLDHVVAVARLFLQQMQHHDAQCALLEHARAASAAAFTAAGAMMAARTAGVFVVEEAAAMMPTVVALVLGAGRAGRGD